MIISFKTFERWLYGLLEGVIAGVATTVASVFGVAAANGAGVKVDALDLDQIVTVAVSAALVSAAMYLKKSPLPARDEDGDGIADK
jgi:hypothetical protein